MKTIMNRLGGGAAVVLLLASCMTAAKPGTGTASAAVSGTGRTVVTIQGTKFLINGQLTSPGKPAEGQLLNTRMAQAIFDDENADTVKYWAYPDTHRWDAQRNTDEFVAMIPTYAQHGIRLVTVGLQGGCPSSSPNPACPGGAHDWIVSAFAADGSLKPAWLSRLKQVIIAADHNGMVVMVQFFYHGQNQRLKDPDTTTAQKAAVNNITDWLVGGGYTNVLVETANECNAGFEPYSDCPNEAAVIKQVQDRSLAGGHRLNTAVSYTGGGMPSDDVLAQEDFVLLHGNGIDGDQLKDLINRVKDNRAYQAHQTPIVVNEDSTSLDNMNASVGQGVSWGYLDTGKNNYEDGFQRPPVNWTINTDVKKAFFDNALRLAGPTPTSLVYGGPTAADYHDDLTMTATLTDIWGNALPDRGLSFSLGAQGCSGVTGASGIAACTIAVAATPGTASVSVHYAGDATFAASASSTPLVVTREETALAYRGDSKLINGVPAHLSAVLTEDGTTPLQGKEIAFQVGTGSAAQTCSGTTDVAGVAACALEASGQPLGTSTVSAAFAGDSFYKSALSTSEISVSAVQSGLTYTGPSGGDFNDEVRLTAALLAEDRPLAGKSVAFTLGTKSCLGTTDTQGIASCSLIPAEAAGSYPLSVTFAGDTSFQASAASASFRVSKEETSLAYTGQTAIHNGGAAGLAATLREDGETGTPLAGRTVSFTLGSGGSSQVCGATTNAAGQAACSIAIVDQPVGAGTVTATFSGDARYQAAGDQPVTEILGSVATNPESASNTTTLATTGQSLLGSPLARFAIGGLSLVIGLLLLLNRRRRPGEPPTLVWRNK